MELPDGIRPDERILILGIPEFPVIQTLCLALTQGQLVAVGERDAVYEARKAAREFHNAMFVHGAPDDLPWRDGFFTRVIDIYGAWAEPEKVRREIERVTGKNPNG